MAQYLVSDLPTGLRLAYRERCPLTAMDTKGTIVLIHGFPQTSYQFRHVMNMLCEQGYRCIAPDYRGAGGSSKSEMDFTKAIMAADIIQLMDKLDLREPAHLVGHDIGGMIAYCLAHRYPERFRTVCWGECPLPGTKTYYRERTEHAVQQFHFIFHSVPDLPEALVAGKERIYLTHFFNKITRNLNAFSEADIDYYTSAYSQPGAMRCGFAVYRAFEQDAEDNLQRLKVSGKCKVPTLILSGEHSRHRAEAQEMALEVTEKDALSQAFVKDSAHYLVEENPQHFGECLLRFIERHT